MEATIELDTKKHYPVLLKEVISIISPQYGGTFIDCTFGQGGYTKKLLEFKNTRVIAIDRDVDSQIKAEKFLNEYKNRFIFKNLKFSQLNNLNLKNKNIKAIVFDLGYSYSQIKDPKKGLSFEFEGNLNMQMGLNSFSADDVVNKLEGNKLEKIFKFFGEEKDSSKIVRRILNERSKKKIDTQTLVELIEKSKKKKILKYIVLLKFFKH